MNDNLGCESMAQTDAFEQPDSWRFLNRFALWVKGHPDWFRAFTIWQRDVGAKKRRRPVRSPMEALMLSIGMTTDSTHWDLLPRRRNEK
jgi:hypothetical protein